MNNNYPSLEDKYENADDLMRLEMNMIYSIENRAMKRRYKRNMFTQELQKLRGEGK